MAFSETIRAGRLTAPDRAQVRIAAFFDPLSAFANSPSVVERKKASLGLKAQGPRHLPVGPESLPGCSERKAAGPSAMLHR